MISFHGGRDDVVAVDFLAAATFLVVVAFLAVVAFLEDAGFAAEEGALALEEGFSESEVADMVDGRRVAGIKLRNDARRWPFIDRRAST